MVAEGVENEVAYAELARLGCDQAQGFFMSRPVPAAELDQWLQSRTAIGDLPEQPAPRLSHTSPVSTGVGPGVDVGAP
jgi:predicted signal transduction protein with EAL and GGDEF domain